MRLGKNISYSGPSLKKVLRVLEKKNIALAKPAVRSSTKLVRTQAKEDAPVVSGRYRKSIRHSVRTNTRAGEVVGKVGIRLGDPVMKYAPMIEKKYFVFTRLEKTQAKPVKQEFKSNIIKTINHIRIN